jgi:hypothetical protein
MMLSCVSVVPDIALVQACIHESMTSKLNMVNGTYNYEGMLFPTTYDDIANVEKINGVCIYIYEFDSEDNIKLGEQGRVYYLAHKLILYII